jgi:hypothetical protein
MPRRPSPWTDTALTMSLDPLLNKAYQSSVHFVGALRRNNLGHVPLHSGNGHGCEF